MTGVEVVRVHRSAEEPRLPLACGQQPGEHLHGRGLAGPVRPQEAEDLAPADAEAHVIDRGKVAETPGEVACFDSDLGFIAQGAVPGLHGAVAGTPVAREQADEGPLQRVRARALEQLVWRARGEHPALVHGDEPVEPRGFFHVSGGNQQAHARPIGTDAAYELPELPS